MSYFYLFSRLPLELRQRVWTMAMEPRRIDLGDRPTLSRTPPLWHACTESRAHLQRYYVEAFEGVWVNFDVDTICINDMALSSTLLQNAPIKRLSVSTSDGEFFWQNAMSAVLAIESLRELEVRPSQKSYPPEANWWRDWDSLMELWYYADDPVPFRTTIISPWSSHKVPKITPENYLQVERDARREKFGRDEVSDSEDDVDAPHRYRTGWRHEPGCGCPSQQPA